MVDVLLATTLEGVNTKALQKLVYKLLLLYFINLEYAVFFERTVRVKSLWVIIKGATNPNLVSHLHPARLRFATPQQAVRTRWLARWRVPIGLRLPPRPHIRRAESIRRWEP